MIERGFLIVSTSQNGWPVVAAAETHRWEINAWCPPFRLQAGHAGFVLAHFALWYGEEVERIRGDTLDDWGWATRPIRGATSGYSNHASGTALDLNAQSHVLGNRHTYTDRQEWLLTQRLRGKYASVIRWGGSYRHRADEMHYEIDADHAVVRALSRRLASTERGQRIRSLNPGVPLR